MYSNLKEGEKIVFDNELMKTVGIIQKVAVSPHFVGSKKKYVVETNAGYKTMVSPSEILGLCR